MKTGALVAFYSRTGNTRKVAGEISRALRCDSEEIEERGSRRGVLGFLFSGFQSSLSLSSEIKPAKKDPGAYGIAIIGTPIWSCTLSAPVRAYLSQNKWHFQKVAFFCTMGGAGGSRAFKDMERLCGKKPLATLEISEDEIADGSYAKKAQEFASQLEKG